MNMMTFLKRYIMHFCSQQSSHHSFRDERLCSALGGKKREENPPSSLVWLASNNPTCQITQLCQSQMWLIILTCASFFFPLTVSGWEFSACLMGNKACYTFQLFKCQLISVYFSHIKSHAFSVTVLDTMWSDSLIFSFHVWKTMYA